MKVITKRGELPSGAPKIIADALGLSDETIRIYTKKGFSVNSNGRKVKEYIEKHYPEFFEGTKIYILTVRTVFGKRMVLGACLKDDLKEMKDKLNKAGVDVDIEELVIGELTDDARRTFFPEEIPEERAKTYGHPIDECMPRTKSGGTIRNILSNLGCDTLEEASALDISVIMEGKGASRRTLFDLACVFDTYGVEYDKDSYAPYKDARFNKTRHLSSRIGMFGTDGELIKEWKSAEEAAEELEIPTYVVETICMGKRKQAKEYILQFIEEK